jgi:hypothetical protein
MKALNKKERNSAIVKFSLWLLICVIIVSVPVILTAFVSTEQKNVEAEDNKNLVEEINFEREFIAGQIQKIMGLMQNRDSKKTDIDSFNAELISIISDIKKQTDTIQNWRGEMYRNVVSISEYLVAANKVMSSSSTNKDKLISDLDKIIVEFETCGENITELADQRKKRDIQAGLGEVDKQFKRAVKLLTNFKSQIR